MSPNVGRSSIQSGSENLIRPVHMGKTPEQMQRAFDELRAEIERWCSYANLEETVSPSHILDVWNDEDSTSPFS